MAIEIRCYAYTDSKAYYRGNSILCPYRYEIVTMAIEIRCYAYTDRKAYYRSKEIQY
jgi:hypothetical protein